MPKILVIDDHKDTLSLIREYLKKENYEVLLCENGVEGEKTAWKEQPDVILLDIMLPDKNGLELCRSLRAHSLTSNIPLLFITARITPEDLRAGFQAGGADYLRKPIERTELIERVKAALKSSEKTQLRIDEEKHQIFNATVVAANHKLKQPLTLINLSVTALRRLLKQEEIGMEQVEQKLTAIQNSVGQINEILTSFLRMENLEIGEYIGEIEMINLRDEITDAEPSPQQD